MSVSHVVGSKETPLMSITIGQLLENTVEKCPDNIAVISPKQECSLTYKQFNEQVNALARGFIHIGLVPGDRIGIWSPNNIEWVTTLYAAAKAGLILVNINPAYRLSELEYALNKVGCKALVLAKTFKSSNYAGMIRELAPEVDKCKPGQLKAEKLSDLESLILIGNEQMKGFYSFSDVQTMVDATDQRLDQISISVDDSVNIQFTSGTTGSPKGATLTHNNIVNNGYFVGRGIGLGPEDRVCCPVPLYHCFGMVMAALACTTVGATLVLPDESFDPLTTLEAVERENCTALYGVPTMFNMILNHPDLDDFDVGSLRTGIVAGSLCPESLMSRILDELNMGEVTNCYGMTETSPVSFQSAVNDSLEKKITTVGQVHPNIEVKIIDLQGAVVPIGVQGQLCTKGYSVMQGYWDDPDKTTESIIDGWMHSGDAAVIDEDGYCAIVGRIKDTIIRGGENIAPKEIEEFLLTHDDILEAQAFGVPDEIFGEIIVAWLKVKEDSLLSPEQVKAYCENRIAHFKIPEIIKFVDEYPLTVTGKVQKFVMREKMQDELGFHSDNKTS